jgi:hypothetical protein
VRTEHRSIASVYRPILAAHPLLIRIFNPTQQKPTVDVSRPLGIINCEHYKGFEMQKLNNEIGMQDKGVIQVFRICSNYNHFWRITRILASGFVSVGGVSDCWLSTSGAVSWQNV